MAIWSSLTAAWCEHVLQAPPGDWRCTGDEGKRTHNTAAQVGHHRAALGRPALSCPQILSPWPPRLVGSLSTASCTAICHCRMDALLAYQPHLPACLPPAHVALHCAPWCLCTALRRCPSSASPSPVRTGPQPLWTLPSSPSPSACPLQTARWVGGVGRLLWRAAVTLAGCRLPDCVTMRGLSVPVSLHLTVAAAWAEWRLHLG